MRVLTATVLIGLVAAAGLAGAAALRHLYADPTPKQYLAHVGGKGEIVPAGEFQSEGRNFSCDHRPTVISEALDDYAAAYYGFLLVNKERFARLPMTLKRYVYAHECAHQYVGRGELAADCHAVREGRREGWLDEKGVDEICGFIGRAKGDATHPAGPKRCEHIRACFSGAAAADAAH
ncbi:MAG: hypothetical protein ACLFU3_08750 [Dichotomicrobium sp.]